MPVLVPTAAVDDAVSDADAVPDAGAGPAAPTAADIPTATRPTAANNTAPGAVLIKKNVLATHSVRFLFGDYLSSARMVLDSR